MNDEELVAIRMRDAHVTQPKTWAEHDRRALVQELDRVRDLWSQCRSNCFDPTIVEREPGPDDTLEI